MTYEDMRAHMIDVPSSIHQELVKVCQKNPWLKNGGIPFEDDPWLEMDSPFSFWQTGSINALRAYFDHGNWSIRNGVLFHDLAFVNQVNGGDEWWTLKRFDGKWLPFESVTFSGIIHRNEFRDFIRRLEAASFEQCKSLNY